MTNQNQGLANTKQRKNTIHRKLDELEKEIEILEDKRNKLVNEMDEIYKNFNDVVLGDKENNCKRNDAELSIYDDIVDTQTRINDYYYKLFDADSQCIEKQIDTALNNLIKNEEESNELKDKIESLLNDSTQLKTEVENNKNDTEEISNELKEIEENANGFNEKINDREVQIKEQNEKIEHSQSELDSLNILSKNHLAELTDKSLHNAFKTEAKSKKRNHLWYFGGAIASLFLSAAVIFCLQIYSVENNIHKIELWVLRLSIVAPLVYIGVICSSKSNVFLKLAEEYQHKASIAESLSGYRKLWKLEHTNHEYKEFFDKVIDSLITNPSDKIKISQKDIFAQITEKMSPINKK